MWTRALPGLASVVLVAAAYPVVRGRTDPAGVELTDAKQALDAARRADAATWAPDALEAAESAFRRASAEHRRQEVRFLSLRDFRAVRESLDVAEKLSREAAAAAKEAKEDMAAIAAKAVKDAETAMEGAQAFADAMPLGKTERAAYGKAQRALTEARSHRKRHDHAAAIAAAQRAIALADDVTHRAASVASRYRDPDSLKMWKSWIAETIEWSRKNQETAIVVDKDGHTLSVYDDGKLVKTYTAELSENWTADKRRSGDWATPEGRYRVTVRKDKGQSIYHKALLIDYPNAEDRAAFAKAKQRGEIPKNATPGGLIEIHGHGGRGRDWTQGCVALSNDDMDEVFARSKVGTRVTIVGSDGNGGTLSSLVDRHRASAAAR